MIPASGCGAVTQAHHRPGLPVHGLRYHRLRRQLQRSEMIRASKGGLPVPHHGADQADYPQYPAFEEYGDLLAAIEQAM